MILTYEKDPSGQPLIRVDGSGYDALLSFRGAQLIQFSSKSNEREMFWSHPQQKITGNLPWRGGSPIVFPWFGPSDTDGFPQHGFARILAWDLVEENPDSLTFELRSSALTNPLWPHQFLLRLTYSFSAKGVDVSAVISNVSDQPFDAEFLLHPYFAVKALEGATVSPLRGIGYYDKLSDSEKTEEEDPVTGTHMDRVYRTAPEELILAENGEEKVRVKCPTGANVVVWNPGPKDKQSTPPPFICIEPGQVRDQKFTVQPGIDHVFEASFHFS